jgi:BMFP domain-containing protein YqiC
MPQTSNRMFDELAKLMTDAASVAQGVRREAESVFRSQVERFINDLDLVKRADFEVVRELASKARTENEALTARIAALEAKLAAGSMASASATSAALAGDEMAEAKPKRPPRKPKPDDV